MLLRQSRRFERPENVQGRIESERDVSQISGDPRRPNDARPYVAPEFNKEENPGDFRLIGSMMFGLAAMLTKVRLMLKHVAAPRVSVFAGLSDAASWRDKYSDICPNLHRSPVIAIEVADPAPNFFPSIKRTTSLRSHFLFVQIPWFGWIGILLNLNYFANMNYAEFDLKATMSAVL